MATTLPVQRHPRSLFPEFSELFAAFPSFAGLRPTFDTRLMRLEDEMKEGRYEVRAELPGVDPDKDVDIMVRDGQLTIKAERTEQKDFDGRSEFAYGSFVRTVSLPVVLTRTTLRPPTTRAFLLCRWRFRKGSQPKSTFRSGPPTDHWVRADDRSG